MTTSEGEEDRDNGPGPARWEIPLRLFAATDDPSVAENLAKSLTSEAGKFGRVRVRPIERCWKIPESHEIGLGIRPRGDARPAYEGLLAALATGWRRGGGPEQPWAVWNPSTEGVSFSPLVTWMSIDTHDHGEDTYKFDFHEKVIIASSHPASEIRDELGLVSGRAYEAGGRWIYSVDLCRTGLTWLCAEDDVLPAGEFDRSEALDP